MVFVRNSELAVGNEFYVCIVVLHCCVFLVSFSFCFYFYEVTVAGLKVEAGVEACL